MQWEAYAKELRPFSVQEVGSPAWMVQRARIEQLNAQAHLDVQSGHDEVVKDAIMLYQKIPVLVHELLAIELWADRVLPIITQRVTGMTHSREHASYTFPAYRLTRTNSQDKLRSSEKLVTILDDKDAIPESKTEKHESPAGVSSSKSKGSRSQSTAPARPTPLLQTNRAVRSNFQVLALKVYVVTRAQSVIANLLEILLFNSDCFDDEDVPEEVWMELVDYVARKAAILCNSRMRHYIDVLAKRDEQKQARELRRGRKIQRKYKKTAGASGASGASGAGARTKGGTAGGDESEVEVSESDDYLDFEASDSSDDEYNDDSKSSDNTSAPTPTHHTFPKEYRMLRRHAVQAQVDSCVCSLTILRYLTDAMAKLPVGVTRRLLCTHDIVLRVVPLIRDNPFHRRHVVTGDMMKRAGSQWQQWSDRNKLSVLDGQLWLIVYNLLLSRSAQSMYQVTRERYTCITALKGCFNSALLDQLPQLQQLRRTVLELSVAQAPAPSSRALAIVETVPGVRERQISQALQVRNVRLGRAADGPNGPGTGSGSGSGDGSEGGPAYWTVRLPAAWGSLADYYALGTAISPQHYTHSSHNQASSNDKQVSSWQGVMAAFQQQEGTLYGFFSVQSSRGCSTIRAQFSQISQVYASDDFNVASGPPQCEHCKVEVATKRCSGCKTVWYCGRRCQVLGWKASHKTECKQLRAEWDRNQQHRVSSVEGMKARAGPLKGQLAAQNAERLGLGSRVVVVGESENEDPKTSGTKVQSGSGGGGGGILLPINRQRTRALQARNIKRFDKTAQSDGTEGDERAFQVSGGGSTDDKPTADGSATVPSESNDDDPNGQSEQSKFSSADQKDGGGSDGVQDGDGATAGVNDTAVKSEISPLIQVLD